MFRNLKRWWDKRKERDYTHAEDRQARGFFEAKAEGIGYDSGPLRDYRHKRDKRNKIASISRRRNRE